MLQSLQMMMKKRVLDFYRSEEIYKQAEPVKEELRRKLEKIYKT